ncbi:hypothetical protein ES703_57714 [subsurface metagenome]
MIAVLLILEKGILLYRRAVVIITVRGMTRTKPILPARAARISTSRKAQLEMRKKGVPIIIKVRIRGRVRPR